MLSQKLLDVANIVEPDQMSPSAPSDQGLHYLLRRFCPNT